MLISGRDATRRLTALGIGERQARRVLAIGLCGRPVRTSAAVLFEEADVEAVVARPVLTPEAALEAARAGWRSEGRPGGEVVVARRDLPSGLGADEQRARLAEGWAMSAWTATYLGTRGLRGEPVGLVATTGGFVTAGLDVDDVRPTGGGRARFDLAPAGPWFAPLAGARVPTGPGREWVLLGEPWPGRILAGHRADHEETRGTDVGRPA